MPKIWNKTRKVNATLKTKTIIGYGRKWAIDDECDGWYIVNVNPDDANLDLKSILEGSETTVFAVPKNVTKLGVGALSTYQNLTDVYLFGDSIKTLNSQSFTLLNNLQNIYVSSSLLNTYETTYPSITIFKELSSDYIWNVPYMGSSELSATTFQGLINMLSKGKKLAITKIVFPNSYSSLEVECSSNLFDKTFGSLEVVEIGSGNMPLGYAYAISQNGSIMEVE